MTCRFCWGIRRFLRRKRQCEACEKAMQAIERHERSTENLTRAALDGIDHMSGYDRNDSDATKHNTRIVEEMLAGMLANAGLRAQQGR